MHDVYNSPRKHPPPRSLSPTSTGGLHLPQFVYTRPKCQEVEMEALQTFFVRQGLSRVSNAVVHLGTYYSCVCVLTAMLNLTILSC